MLSERFYDLLAALLSDDHTMETYRSIRSDRHILITLLEDD